MMDEDEGNAIHVTIGVADEVYHMPMEYWMFDEGVHFGNDFTFKDLTVSKAVLLDLADAIDKKLAETVN